MEQTAQAVVRELPAITPTPNTPSGTDTSRPVVRLIPASIQKVEQNVPVQKQKLRVAAYCRVSSDKDEQANSYDSQITFYNTIIDENPNWTNAGVFADKGLSGTIVNRPNFKKLLRIAMKGKIDLIIVKSISRFARNTVITIETARKLRDRGVGILFEKEGYNTLACDDEMLLAIYSAAAQNESTSMSKNITMGNTQAFKAGKGRFNYCLLGYRKGADGRPEVIPEEAAIVRRIYREYLAGGSYRSICESLERDNIPTKKGQAKWSHQVVKGILSNERYIGDILCQKTFVENPLTHKAKRNQGQRPQYYIENHHPEAVIISREVFEQAQMERNDRNGIKARSARAKSSIAKYSANPLTGILTCAHCGSQLRRNNYRDLRVWRCIGRIEFGQKFCPHSETVYEAELKDAIMKAISLNVPWQELFRTLEDALATDGTEDSIQALRLKEQTLLQTIGEYAGSDRPGAELKMQELRQEYSQVIGRILAKEAEAGDQQEGVSGSKELVDKLREREHIVPFSGDLVRHLIQQIRITDAEHANVLLYDGQEMDIMIQTGNRRRRGRPKVCPPLSAD